MENSTVSEPSQRNWTKTGDYIAFNPLERVCLISALSIATLAIIIGNSLVLIVLSRQRKTASQRVVTIFLGNLAFMDLSIALLIMPLSISTYIHGKWPFGRVVCEVNGFTTMLVGIVAILTMTAIAVDRYRIIVLTAGQRLLPKHAYRILVFIWLWAIVQSLPPVLGWNEYIWSPTSSVCRAKFGQKDGYIELVAFLSYIVPLCIMVFCYLRVYITVRQSRRRVEMWAKFTQDVWLRAETHTAKVVFTVLTAFIICWTPFVLIYAISGSGVVTIPQEAFIFTGFMASSHSVCNPIIYLTMNKRFRNDLILLVCRRRLRDTSGNLTIRPSNIPRIIQTMRVIDDGEEENGDEKMTNGARN